MPAMLEEGRIDCATRGLPRASGSSFPERPIMRPVFVNIGERTNVTGSAKFKKLIVEGELRRSAVGGAPAGRGRRPGHRRQHGRGPAGRSKLAMITFLNLMAAEPDIARVPVMIDSSKWEVIEAGPEVRAGQGDRQLDLHEGGRGQVHRAGQAVPALRRRRGGHGLRRGGSGRHRRPQDRDLRAGLQYPGPTRWASRRRTSSSTPTSSPWRRGSRSTTTTPSTSSRARGEIKASAAPMPASRAGCRTSRSASAATSRCAGRSTRCSCTTPSMPGMDMGIVNAGDLPVYDTSRPGTARGRRGRDPQPPAADQCLQHRALVDGARATRATRPGPGGQSGMARGQRSASASPTPWSTASPSSSRRTPKRPRLGRAPAARHRRPADGRHERGRRPVRRGQDVPAAGGQVGPRDEAGRGLAGAVHGGREGRQGRASRPAARC